MFGIFKGLAAAIVALSFLNTVLLSPPAGATESLSWTKEPVQVSQKVDYNPNVFMNPQYPFCHLEYVTTRYHGLTQLNKKACVITGKYISIGYIEAGFYVSYNNDNKYYYYEQSNRERLYLVPGTDRIVVYTSHPHITGGSIYVYDNAASRFSISARDGYSLLQERGNAVFPKNRMVNASEYYTSENGKYLVYIIDAGYTNDDIFVRVNLGTGEEKEFGRGWYSHTYNPLPMPNAAISNDGKFVIAGGIDRIKVWDLSSECLKPVTNQTSRYPDHCPARVIMPQEYNETYSYNAQTQWFRFDDDMKRINFIYANNTVTKMITLKPSNLPEVSRLSYLALGDSYSSGEGDIDKKPNGLSYYAPNTDKPGGCHLSERSYPFWLKNKLNLYSDTMRSVACSGAQLSLDYYLPTQSYFGQHNERQGMTDEQYQAASAEALTLFNPGIVSQIEFVRRYKPIIVTMTGGGNDVGFGEILNYCAAPDWKGFFWGGYVCDYAKPGTVLNKILGSAIRNQFMYTKLFLKKVKEVSPDTKVYVVGYPMFIGSSDKTCALNSGALEDSEVDIIQEGVIYLNSTLKQAAESEGAFYRDIENSLMGGRLCEGSKYVTGVWDIGYNLEKHKQETFHPNAAGHQKMATAIINEGISLNSEAPNALDHKGPLPIPLSLGGETNTKATKKKMTLVDAIKKGATMLITLPSYSFAPATPVSVKVYSKEIDLGTFVADSTGGLNLENISVSTLPLGIHTLVVSGESISGEHLMYYQQILAVSDDENDKDEDGILDKNDPCLFIEHWYDETTGKDQCEKVSIGNIQQPTVQSPIGNKEVNMSQPINSNITNTTKVSVSRRSLPKTIEDASIFSSLLPTSDNQNRVQMPSKLNWSVDHPNDDRQSGSSTKNNLILAMVMVVVLVVSLGWIFLKRKN